MHRLKLYLTVFLVGLICWVPIFQPISVYAETVLGDAAEGIESGTASGDDAVPVEPGDDLVESSDNEEAGEVESSSDESGSPDGSDAVVEDGEDAAVPDEAVEPDPIVDNTANGFVPNSWRYDNGVLRSDLESVAPSTLSNGDLPAGATGWGIDVSEFQGSIDWAKVKASGVDFVILRCGYGRGEIDSRFAEYVAGCKKHDIPFGVYLYCYAWDAESAKAEAEGTLRILSSVGVKPEDLALPIYYDIENTVGRPDHPDYGKPAGVDNNNQYRVIQDNATFASMGRAYCSTIEAAGFTAGVYANTSWWNRYLNDPVFDSWDRWVAQYWVECEYEGDYSLWQYSSSGRVDGIKGNVDVNWCYNPIFSKPDLSDFKLTASVNKDGVLAVLESSSSAPLNTAFEVRSPSGAVRWFQAYEKADGSWSALIDLPSAFSEWGSFSISAYCSYASGTHAVASKTVTISSPTASISLRSEPGSTFVVADGWTIGPSNVAFEVRTSSGSVFWYQGYEKEDGSWVSYEASGILVTSKGVSTVKAWASYGDITASYGSMTVEADPVSPDFSAAAEGDLLRLASTGWNYEPSNVAFEVKSPSSKTRWVQAHRQDDGSWSADVSAMEELDGWGTYHVACWATFGSTTKSFGDAEATVAPGELALDISTQRGALSLSASGWSVAPSNVSFEIRPPSGATRWCQAYRQPDGSWTGELSDHIELGTYKVSAWATVRSYTGKAASTSYSTPSVKPTIEAEQDGHHMRLSASDWVLGPSNVAFEVKSSSGKTRWAQAYRQDDGSWSADVSAADDFAQWGSYGITCWASYGSRTSSYGSTGVTIDPGSIRVSATRSDNIKISASATGWKIAPSNVSFAVLLDSGSTKWIQAHENKDGSWSADFSVASLGEWGSYRIRCFATIGKMTSSYGECVLTIDIGDITTTADVDGGSFSLRSTGWKTTPKNVSFRVVDPSGQEGWLQGIQGADGSWTASSNTTQGFTRYGTYQVYTYAEIYGYTTSVSSTSFIFPRYIGFQNPSQYYQVSNASVTIKNMGSGIFGYRTESRIPFNATRNDCINAMVTRAFDYLGSPYIWDYACAPGVGVDCAGLVMQCLYATGMDLSPMNPWDHYYTPGHDQYANYMWQYGRFQHLPFSERQRGDIISTPGHVSIYLGNDQIIEAYSPRTGVRISSVYSSPNIRGVLRPFV